ncbi:hypothetical protein DCC25_05625 [Auritidibacter sp. NML120636]|nr:hypothetical protein DCC25_05625 [Auritidibacter sp. NML120636]
MRTFIPINWLRGNASTQARFRLAMALHNDMIRTVAMAFWGIFYDNPSSAETIRSAEHDLLINNDPIDTE